jgi:two-component system, NarL family, response regulator LiaR
MGRFSGPRAAETDSPVRVIIADDDPLARRAVRDALQDAGIVVIAEASNGLDAVQLGLHYEPDVILMDVVMPGMDGVTATRKVCERAPHVKVVMLSANADDDVGLLCLRAGAAGFLAKSVSIASLPRALRAARDGEAVISRQLTTRLIEGLRRTPVDGVGLRPVRSPLTPREWEVLDMLCQDASTEEIADALVLSSETVRSHVKNILRKLGVGSRRQAVEAARRMRSDIIVTEPAAA